MKTTKRFDGFVVLITGANGGIGHDIVRAFAENGATVFATDVNLSDRIEKVEGGSNRVIYSAMNVTDSAEIDAVVGRIEHEFGRLDTVVNVAAMIGSGKKMDDVSEQEFDRIFSVNVKGTWLVTRRSVRAMKKFPQSNQSIVHFSSIAGLVAVSEEQAVYSATKGAVRLMAKNDAIALAPYGIRVNSIHPGSVETEMSKVTEENHPLGAEYGRRLIAKHPLGRRALPAEIARGVLFLASSDSSFMTGTELVIDGGYTAQ